MQPSSVCYLIKLVPKGTPSTENTMARYIEFDVPCTSEETCVMAWQNYLRNPRCRFVCKVTGEQDEPPDAYIIRREVATTFTLCRKLPDSPRLGFEERLRQVLARFIMKQAIELSDELHKAEASGVDLTDSEEHLWKKLTARIVANSLKF